MAAVNTLSMRCNRRSRSASDIARLLGANPAAPVALGRKLCRWHLTFKFKSASNLSATPIGAAAVSARVSRGRQPRAEFTKARSRTSKFHMPSQIVIPIELYTAENKLPRMGSTRRADSQYSRRRGNSGTIRRRTVKRGWELFTEKQSAHGYDGFEVWDLAGSFFSTQRQSPTRRAEDGSA
jgi:hypothetical protein